MRYLCLSLLTLLVLPFIIGLQEADAATWYNSSWLKARKITIDQTDIDTADLTNYPLYVNMTLVNVGTDSQADCDDFVFVDSTNVTKLDHEIETCSDANNWAEFWVEVPTVDFDADTIIFMYYDNAVSTDQQATQATWNSEIASVYHLNGTFNDSTGNVAHCTNSGTSEVTDDYIGDSRSWDKINDYIDCNSPTATDNLFTGGGTISAWINTTSTGESDVGAIFYKRTGTTEGWFTRLQLGSASHQIFTFFHEGGATDIRWSTTNPEIKNQVWTFITITYDVGSTSNIPILYVNGSSVPTSQVTGPPSNTGSLSTADLCLGNNLQNASTCNTAFTFDGRMDEMRLYNTNQTASWIKADWECQRGAVDGNSCITVGNEGEEPLTDFTVSVSDEIAVEDSVTYSTMNTVNVSDDIAVEDTGTAYLSTTTVTDDIAVEDTASAALSATVTVSDDIPVEDAVSFTTTNTLTVSDDIPVEDAVSIVAPGQVTVSDEIAVEDLVSYSTENTVNVSDDIAVEDSASYSTMNTVTVSDDIPVEDAVSIVAPGQVTVSDEIAVEDFGGLDTITVSDFIALEDSASLGGVTTPTRNAIAIYVNKSPFILGVFSDATRMTCTGSILGGIIFNTDDNMINLCNGVNWTFYNGTIT